MMMKKRRRRVVKMTQVEVKPIRPTKVIFSTKKEKDEFIDRNITNNQNTHSIGMDKIRKMLSEYSERNE